MRENRPSHTATKVSKALLYMAQDPRLAPLLPEGAAECTEELLAAAGLLGLWERRLLRTRQFQRYLAGLERYTLPGAVLHLGLRKRFMDDEVRLAIAQGARQVLVVGAGFDTLCVRLAARFPQVTFIELDHPGTYGAKIIGVEAVGGFRPNLHLVSVDLGSASLEGALAEAGVWREDCLSVVVAEGLLMYLDEGAICGFLEAVRESTGKGSRLLCTYLRSDDAGRVVFGRFTGLTQWWLNLVGEPFRWAIKPEALGAFLEPLGFRLDRAPERCDMRQRYLVPAELGHRPLAEFECVAVTEILGPGIAADRPVAGLVSSRRKAGTE